MDVTKTCRDISELKGVAQTACKLFLDECKKAGLDIFITETYRSQARQNYLYAQGRTRPGNEVTWTLNSRHTSRLAWDIATNGKDLYDKSVIDKAGAIAEKLGITWGKRFKDAKGKPIPDSPHFEIKSTWKAPNIPVEKQETKKDGVRMYKPSNETFLNETLTVLKRLEDKKVHGDKALAPIHREKLLKGQLSIDDAVGIFYVALSRGLTGK